ncbi:hypothetical protein DSO52_21745 [Salmonella enterica]|nr:hypothetical protein [Salmonella enterica]
MKTPFELPPILAILISACPTAWASTIDLGLIPYSRLPTVGGDINFTYVLVREDPAVLNAWGSRHVSTLFNVGTLDEQLITGGTTYNDRWTAVGWECAGGATGVECTIKGTVVELPGSASCLQSLKAAIGYRDLDDLGLDTFVPASSLDNLMITFAKAIKNDAIDAGTGVFIGGSRAADLDKDNLYAALGPQTAKIRIDHKALKLGALPGTPGSEAYVCLESADPSDG